ncbi:hypothetical protein FAIPA1_10182 [Frankia sp. AiPs1]
MLTRSRVRPPVIGLGRVGEPATVARQGTIGESGLLPKGNRPWDCTCARSTRPTNR